MLTTNPLIYAGLPLVWHKNHVATSIILQTFDKFYSVGTSKLGVLTAVNSCPITISLLTIKSATAAKSNQRPNQRRSQTQINDQINERRKIKSTIKNHTKPNINSPKSNAPNQDDALLMIKN